MKSSRESTMSDGVSVRCLGDFLCHHHQGLVWCVVRLRFTIRPRLRLRIYCFRPLDRAVLSVSASCYALIICSTFTTRVNRPSISAASVGRWLAFLVWPLGPGVKRVSCWCYICCCRHFIRLPCRDEFGGNAAADVCLALIGADDTSIIVGSGNIYTVI